MQEDQILYNKVSAIVDKIDSLHPEDEIKCYEYWGELTELLVANESRTIALLESLEDKNIVNNLSSVFEDVSKELKSEEFIACIEKFIDKYPDLILVHMVNAAKDHMP